MEKYITNGFCLKPAVIVYDVRFE